MLKFQPSEMLTYIRGNLDYFVHESMKELDGAVALNSDDPPEILKAFQEYFAKEMEAITH